MYVSAEDVRKEHSGHFFRRWGWLVAEVNGQVVGEITFRTEKNYAMGLIGIVTSLDVDVRFQKNGIGSALVEAAEQVLRKRGAVRVLTNTPPASYNFWMRLKYFACDSPLCLEANIKNLKAKKKTKLTARRITKFRYLPASIRYSHFAPVNLMTTLAGEILDNNQSGLILEFHNDSTFIGSAVVVRRQTHNEFVVDVTPAGVPWFEEVISATVQKISKTKNSRIRTVILPEHLHSYKTTGRWGVKEANHTTVARVL